MITKVIAAAARDALELAKEDGFFEENAGARKARVKSAFPEYPNSLQTYLSEISAAHFAKDMESMLPLLAAGSVMAYGRKAAQHRFLKACAESLKELWVSGEISEKTYFGRVLSVLLQDRGATRMGRVAEREVQQFVELVLHEDSPQIQVAESLDSTPYGRLQELYGGIPSFQIRRQLLGGSRLFVKGKLIDASWRARVQTFLSALK